MYLGPRLTPTPLPIPIATLVSKPPRVTETYEIRSLVPDDKVSQEKAYYRHFRA